MLQKVIIAAATVALWSAAAEAAEITGYLHNNRAEGRATLETGDGVYLLDFGSSYLLDISERHDRKRVRVRGTLSSTRCDSSGSSCREHDIPPVQRRSDNL